MTEAEVRKILSDVVPAIAWDNVGRDDDLTEAGLDSLDKASAIMEIETAAGVRIDDSRYDDITTIAALVQASESA